MKIKDPVLLLKQHVAVYEVDVDGTKIEVTYVYNLDEEGKGFWEYDLELLYEGLDENEIDELEDQFNEVISEIGV